jgi:flagellar motor component MotA
VLNALKAALGDEVVSLEDAREHMTTLGTARMLFNALGGAGVLIGLIRMLSNLEDPTEIGPSMAIALLTAMYAVMSAELFLAPLINRLAAKVGEEHKGDELLSSRRRGVTPLSMVFGLLGFAAIIPAISMDPMKFMDGRSLVMVWGFMVFWSLANHSPAHIREAIAAGLGEQPLRKGEALTHAAVLSTMRISVIGAGIIGMLIGLVKMLQNLEDPTKIGPALAVALLTPLYGVLTAELCIGNLCRRLGDAAGNGEGLVSTVEHRFTQQLLVVFAGLLVFFVMLLSMASFV